MSPRSSTFRQSDITRALKGAMAAGIVVQEVHASKDGIRIISTAGERPVVIEDGAESPFQKWKEKNAGKA